MKQHIVQALKLSLIPDSNSLKIATESLLKMSSMPGYCYNSMEIADDTSIDIQVRQAALAQCKNVIKRHWSQIMTLEEKQSILNTLLPAFIRSSSQRPLLKLYQQVVATIVGFSYSCWSPVQQLKHKIRNNENIVPSLQFIVAICTSFEFSFSEQETKYCYQFFLSIVSDLFELVQRNHDSQVIYLIMKIFWKIVHYEVSDDVRKAISSGMDIIITVFGAVNPQFEGSIEQFQNKGTPEFYYFHTKKWATRIIYKFIYRHANHLPTFMMSEEVKQINKQFSKIWYDSYGQKIIDNLIHQFSVPTIKKIRYFQLKCMEGLIKTQPTVMASYSQNFQYFILPQYLKLQPEDQQTAENEPLQFINRQEDTAMDFTNLKRAATEVWISFSNLGSKKKQKGVAYQPGFHFYKNMQFIQNKLEGSNMLQKQMAMYLICELKQLINDCKAVKKMLPQLISKYVITEFTNQIMFLRARAIQIFNEYGNLDYSKEILNKAVEGIYFCLTGDNYPYVRIKAAMAFHVLLNHEAARELVKPFFQEILKVYIQLVQKYDLELLVHSLSSFVEHFPLQIGPYSWQLINYLSRHFVKLYQKDNEQSQAENYDGETQLAAAGILSTMTTIIESPIQKQIIQKMENDILPVCQFVFSAQDCDYIEDVLSLLAAYTFKVDQISQNLAFFYVLSIYYVTGIPKPLWEIIPNLELSNQRIKSLLNVKNGCNIEALDTTMPVLRNFISKSSQLLYRTTDMFGVNLIQLLFQMTKQIYEHGPSQFDGEIQMNSCTILMIYLIENNLKVWPETIINHIWELVKQNLLKAKSKVLRSLNAQLICVLFWNCSQYIIIKAHQDNMLRLLFECIIQSESKIKEEHQRQRLIYGITQILSLDEKPNQFFEFADKLFQFLVSLVKKNAELRLDSSADQNYQTDSEQDEQRLIFGEDEPQDIWEENYNHNYSNKLDQKDEIARFKQFIQGIQIKNNDLYNKLIQTVPQDELINLNSLIEKAININIS